MGFGMFLSLTGGSLDAETNEGLPKGLYDASSGCSAVPPTGHSAGPLAPLTQHLGLGRQSKPPCPREQSSQS